MSVTLPVELSGDPLFRVRYADVFNGTLIEVPMQADGVNGMEIIRIKRVALPGDDEAVLRFKYGLISGRLYCLANSTMINIFNGEAFTPSDSELLLPDLFGKEIIIETYDTSTDTWKTIFWGECIAQPDYPVPGSWYPDGYVEYHLRGGLYRTKKWIINYHLANVNGTLYSSDGHPGFNAASTDGKTIGNKAITPSNTHTWEGINTQFWTDYTTLQTMLALYKGDNDPSISVSDLTGFLNVRSRVYQDLDGVRVRDLIDRILAFDSGVVAFLTWDDVEGWPSPRIECRPLFKGDDVTGEFKWYNPATGSTSTYYGANYLGRSIFDLDFVGDHRLGPDAESTFQVNREYATQFDSVETYGERILVLANLSSSDGTLEARWSSTEATSFGISTSKSLESEVIKWGDVYKTVGLKKDWDGNVGNGLGGGLSSIAYGCDREGNVYLQTVDDIGRLPISPLVVDIEDRLPIYYGWSYTSTPSKISGTQTIKPVQAGIQVFIKSSANSWIDAGVLGSISVEKAGETRADLRFDNGDSVVPFFLFNAIADVSITVGIRLPSRVGISSVAQSSSITGYDDYRVQRLNSDTPARTKRVMVKGCELWLAHEGAVWSLDSTGAPLRNCGGLPASGLNYTVLRDDRAKLAAIHASLVEWHLVPRKTVTWKQEGFFLWPLDPWKDEELTTESTGYIKLGWFLDTVLLSGRRETIGTVVTSIEYNHVEGSTTVVTSWGEGDWK